MNESICVAIFCLLFSKLSEDENIQKEASDVRHGLKNRRILLVRHSLGKNKDAPKISFRLGGWVLQAV